MTALAMYACQWRELRPITFGGSAAATAGTGTGNETGGSSAAPTEEVGDEEMGYGRRGRGRGRDGAGEYEMVAMPSKDEA